jgi:Asp-tRNA(Asn)/Glu-tRNA(Gln) amidotransferase A subunit family amidase
VSPVELVELFLRRIESLNPKLNAYLTVSREQAVAAARAAEQEIARGENRRPLLGIPVSVKDLEMTSGIRSTVGSLVFRDNVPAEDSIQNHLR